MARLARDDVRRITVDRSGVGFSDPLPDRALLDWPDDVHERSPTRSVSSTSRSSARQVAGLTRRRAASRCPSGSTRAALVSGLGPVDRPGAWEGMDRGEARTMLLARRAPWLARLLVGTAVAAERHRPGTVYRGLMKALPDADRRVAAQPRVRESLSDSFTLGFRQGVRGRCTTGG